MTWQEGQSGNPKGARKSKPWREALERALTKLDEGKPTGTTLALIAEKCAAQALEGDKDARKEIAERYDGKVPQAIIGDAGEDPINIITEIRRTIVRPGSTSGGSIPPATEPS